MNLSLTMSCLLFVTYENFQYTQIVFLRFIQYRKSYKQNDLQIRNINCDYFDECNSHRYVIL